MEVEFVQVHVTVPSAGVARDIADVLVGERLAACVQVIADIASTYSWGPEIERSQESLLLAKTTLETFDALAIRVRQLHPYEVPQVTGTPILSVDAAYAEWMRSVLRG
ncbi:divalent-cation tolerance protein CutA [Yimella sp. cx-51]|uniref:divalent-cation tolerance protein CutA n=1 Tax=Yimella sp. cx-51 TaxID=2770551 RepID=UPI00165D36EA|nr:divalent-cation tolerance protein CutA [Yimella sp. cx-51]MBC9956604.1 divalent-cation tolerance protein CutA [Yimella sp. cx-51]QTH38297.1 divalent-cation tolerance protein CutA [Yimella sp. cx-51]